MLSFQIIYKAMQLLYKLLLHYTVQGIIRKKNPCSIQMQIFFPDILSCMWLNLRAQNPGRCSVPWTSRSIFTDEGHEASWDSFASSQWESKDYHDNFLVWLPPLSTCFLLGTWKGYMSSLSQINGLGQWTVGRNNATSRLKHLVAGVRNFHAISLSQGPRRATCSSQCPVSLKGRLEQPFQYSQKYWIHVGILCRNGND